MMMKKTTMFGIIIGIVMIVSAAISVVSMKLTTVSFGVNGQSIPWFTLGGIYDPSITKYSGDGYYLQLNPMNETFSGWFDATNGYRYNFTGTYDIEGNIIIGTWSIGRTSGWILGHIGI
jgi:hypothetical protein